jgi:hypothetical protein
MMWSSAVGSGDGGKANCRVSDSTRFRVWPAETVTS